MPGEGRGEIRQTAVKSFRMARLGFPHAELRRVLAQRICKRMFATWQGTLPTFTGTDTRLTGTPPPIPQNTESRTSTIEAEATRIMGQLELGDERFFEEFSERLERVFSGDPLKRCQRLVQEALETRGRESGEVAIVRLFQKVDDLLAFDPKTPEVNSAGLDFAQKLRDEFKYGRYLPMSESTSISLSSASSRLKEGDGRNTSSLSKAVSRL